MRNIKIQNLNNAYDAADRDYLVGIPGKPEVIVSPSPNNPQVWWAIDAELNDRLGLDEHPADHEVQVLADGPVEAANAYLAHMALFA